MTIQQIMRVLLLLTTVSARAISKSQKDYLENYRFVPVLGECYQSYDSTELLPICGKVPDPESQSCIKWTPNDCTCLGLTTPSNETVVFGCTTHKRSDKCFEVYDANQNVNIVCQEVFEGHAVGVTTPDNFTILFYSHLCELAKVPKGRWGVLSSSEYTSGSPRKRGSRHINFFSKNYEQHPQGFSMLGSLPTIEPKRKRRCNYMRH